MLLCLRVKNFAIIDRLEVEFGPGLNVVTGETGAGKSILVNALQLVLGARGRPDMLRTGADSAEVEALFDIADDPDVQARLRPTPLTHESDPDTHLEAHPDLNDNPNPDPDPDPPLETELVLRRVIAKNGRTRAFANNRLTTATQLAFLTRGLASISSQHEHHALVDPSTHLHFLDAFAKLLPLRQKLVDAHATLLQTRAEHETTRQKSADRIEREDLLRYQVNEIASINPQPDELDTLLEQRHRLHHAERLASTTLAAEHTLYNADDALSSRLSRIAADLRDASALDPALSPLADQLDSAQAQLEDASRELGTYGRNIIADPERLAEIDDRISALQRLARKYGGSIDAVLQHHQRALTELDDLSQTDQHLESLAQALANSLDASKTLARKLSAARKKAAVKLARAIGKELSSLGMGEARVIVEVLPAPRRDPAAITIDNARLTALGIDRVEFLIATNRGEQPRPLHKIASGGELSRAMLAVKRVLTGLGPSGLYVFDEVDAGIGGAMAEVIGRKLQQIARHHQVICITHLPQIAVFASSHFNVHKTVDRGRTHSRITLLDKKQRQDEIARMLGGVNITAKTRAAAIEMLRSAK